MLLNLKYEIFPTEEQKYTLNRWLQHCRQTYNSALLDKQRKYRSSKQSYTREDMQRQLTIDKKKYYFLKDMPSQPLQEVFLRLKKAFENLQGGVLIKVEPQYTSQDCSTCGERIKKSLSIRTHICPKCGTILDRDYNASLNILQKGLEHLVVTN